MLETLIRPSDEVKKNRVLGEPIIHVVFPENSPSVEDYQKALGLEYLDRSLVLELVQGNHMSNLLSSLISRKDLAEIKRRNDHRSGMWTVYLAPEAYGTFIDYYTHPLFLKELRHSRNVPSTEDSMREIVTKITERLNERPQAKKSQPIQPIMH